MEQKNTKTANQKDTGSTSVQINRLTEKITSLSEHLKKHPQDKHSRRGLIGMINQKKKLEKYFRSLSK
jgi:small subunit ribosomal protein S15